MMDRKNEVFDEQERLRQPEVIPSKNIFLILSIFAIVASISGFFILLSIITVSRSSTTILYPYGFILGFLLLLGGVILLLGLIFLHQESKKTIGMVLSNTNENEPNI
ncbi:MAG: hypothetical protein ACFFFH_01665 [Candidatus Thorarchaeota archaeon]